MGELYVLYLLNFLRCAYKDEGSEGEYQIPILNQYPFKTLKDATFDIEQKM